MVEDIYLVIYGCIGLIVFFVHIIILSLLLWYPNLRQKKSNQLLININIGHAITGSTLFATIFYPHSNLLTYINYAGYAHGNVSLTMLTVDRCFMIRRPFLYQTLPAAFHVALLVTSPVVALSIFTEAVVNRLHVASDKDRFTMTLFVYAIIIVTIVLLTLNTLVYLTLLKQKKLIKSCQVVPIGYNTENNTTNTITNNNSNSCDDPAASKKVWKVRQDVRSFYICIGCVLTSIVLWMPELIRQSIWLFGGDGKLHGDAFMGVARILLNLNPLCDAVILIWFNRDLKNKLRNIAGLLSVPNKRITSQAVTIVSQV